ncbi:peptidoglycan-binding domain-containing protein [Marinihelvus fidelis]|nr:peptidoglycan-binding domain-containing protein [Marinihelvus fidelis]
MKTCALGALLLILSMAATPAIADDLTKMVQTDLVALGYTPGNTNGDMDTATIVAISKFQSENDLEVTGEPSPQLAGILKAKLSGGATPAAQTVAPAPRQRTEAELQAAQQACIQEKVAAAQEAQKKKRGFGRLLNAAARTAGRFGNNDVYQVSRDIYDVNATVDDVNAAAKDLGISESELEECRNPPG